MEGGLSNADFAKLFRQQLRAEDADADAASPTRSEKESVAESAQRNDDNRGASAAGEQDWEAEERPSFANPSALHGIGMASRKAQTGENVSTTIASTTVRRKFAWEKHSSGFGAKMLAKMGFKERLGKNEDGVSGVIEVKQRPTQMGIGFGNFTEASASKHNQKLQKELRGEIVVDDDVSADRQAGQSAYFREDDALWRKRKAVASGGKHYKRATDLAQQGQTVKKKRSDVILDMRGPDVRILSDVSSAYSVSAQQIEDAKPKLGDELIYNVRMIVNLAEGKIYDLTQKIATDAENAESMRKEAKIIRAQLQMDAVRLRNVHNMMDQLKKLAEIRDAAAEAATVVPILEHLDAIRRQSPVEFEANKLVQLIPSLCLPPLRRVVATASLQDKDNVAGLVAEFRHIQLFLLEAPEASEADADHPMGVFPVIREKTSEIGDDLYNFVLEEVLWPAMVQFVNVEWNPKRDAESCINLYHQFYPHLTNGFRRAFLQDVVLGRLKKECARWDPRTDSIPVHDWIFPWIPLLNEALRPLFPDIRLAIGNALNQWHPSDRSVLSVLSPWREVWGDQEYAKFTHRHIIRKLTRCLQRDLVIDPQNQKLDPLQWVLAWRSSLPERQFVALLEGEFFSKWLRTLRNWLCADPDFGEVVKWYCGWKAFFDRNQLATQPRFVIYLNGALVLLNAACEEDSSGDRSLRLLPDLHPKTPTSYQDALVQGNDSLLSDDSDDSATNKAGNRRPAPKSSSVKSSRDAHAVTLKDVVENLAISNNLMFMPKGLHDGQQVYVFGKKHIMIEQGVVFLEGAKGDFKPVEVENLL